MRERVSGAASLPVSFLVPEMPDHVFRLNQRQMQARDHSAAVSGTFAPAP